MHSYLKIMLRNLSRDKVYATINIAGLALAVCCCLVIALYLRNELTYDQHNVNHERIFRVITDLDKNGTFPRTPRALGPLLKRNHPGIDYVRFSSAGDNIVMRHEDQAYYWKKAYAVTDNIFAVFTHRVIHGDPATALAAPNSIAVSESFARKYFGDTDPLGKIIVGDANVPRKITLVFADLPDNTHLKYDFLLSASQESMRAADARAPSVQDFMAFSDYTYLYLPENMKAADVEIMLADLLKKTLQSSFKDPIPSHRLQPLADIHLYAKTPFDEPTANPVYIFGFAGIGIFILLTACINYINLATARATRIAKSVGIRKILGAERTALMAQFLQESVFFALLAAVTGMALVEMVLTLSPLNSLIGKQLSLNLGETPALLFWTLGVTGVIGLLAGLYPAFYLSSLAPVTTIAKQHSGSKSNVRFRQVLVFLQFVISISVAVCTLLMLSQLRFVHNKALGFAKENRVMVTMRGTDVIGKAPAIARELSADKHILDIATSSFSMGNNLASLNEVSAESNQVQKEKVRASQLSIGENFIKTMGMRLVAGRDFQKDMPTDMQSGVIVNETFVRKMGWTEPIGKRIDGIVPMHRTVFDLGELRPAKVIGVVADVHFQSLHNAIEPFYMVIDENDFSHLPDMAKRFITKTMILNISGENLGETLKLIEQKFSQADPSHPFEFRFVEDSINALYHAERNVMKLVGIFATICLLISCMGLFGLSMFNTEQRTKEIGIRKVLGASTAQIIALLSRNILLLIIISAVFASGIAYLAMHEWLAGFAYRAAINPLVFITAALAAIMVVYLTIALQSYKTASANPIKALRYE